MIHPNKGHTAIAGLIWGLPISLVLWVLILWVAYEVWRRVG